MPDTPNVSAYLDAAFDVLTDMANDYKHGTPHQRDASKFLYDAATAIGKASDSLRRDR